jgi:hypothetical protein
MYSVREISLFMRANSTCRILIKGISIRFSPVSQVILQTIFENGHHFGSISKYLQRLSMHSVLFEVANRHGTGGLQADPANNQNSAPISLISNPVRLTLIIAAIVWECQLFLPGDEFSMHAGVFFFRWIL